MNTIASMPYQPSLKRLLFGGYVPPEVPGRLHSLDDPPSKLQISAMNRKPRKVESPKRTAIVQSFKPGLWLTVIQLAESTGSTTLYVQKQILDLMRKDILIRRQIVKGQHKRWYEYQLARK